jgi:phage tail tape-measure protein
MGILGKKFGEFTKKIGSKTTYGALKQFGNKVSKSLHSGIEDAADIGGKVSNVLGKVRDVADGLRGVPIVGTAATIVGGGISQVKNVIDMGRKGVKGLEKAVKHTEAIGNVIDTHHKSIGKAITNGDTSSIIGAAKSVVDVAQKNPFK